MYLSKIFEVRAFLLLKFCKIINVSFLETEGVFLIIGGRECLLILSFLTKNWGSRREYDRVGISSDQREKCVNMVS